MISALSAKPISFILKSGAIANIDFSKEEKYVVSIKSLSICTISPKSWNVS